MDVAYVSTFAALGGSMVGGLISGVATRLAQRSQISAGYRAHQISHREELFRDFLLAASKARSQAMMSNQPDLPSLVSMYGAINRMEVMCFPRTVKCAQRAARATIEVYSEPNKALPDILAMMNSGTWINPLSEFAAAAREELRALTSRRTHDRPR